MVKLDKAQAVARLEAMSVKVSGRFRGHSLKAMFDDAFAVYKAGIAAEAAEALRLVVMEWNSTALKADRISEAEWDENDEVVDFLAAA